MSEQTFSFDTMAIVLAVAAEKGVNLGGKDYKLMSELDGNRGADGFNHLFRKVKARAKELKEMRDSGETPKPAAPAAKGKAGKLAGTGGAGGKRARNQKSKKDEARDDDEDESPAKRVKRENPEGDEHVNGGDAEGEWDV